MRDYWLTQYILATVGWTYIGISTIATMLALWIPSSKRVKLIAVLTVGGLVSLPLLAGYEQYRQDKIAADHYRIKLTKAQAMFQERCKTAGEKIYRVVDGIEGFMLEHLRPKEINFSNQYAMDDPYGQQNLGGFDYIRSFLYGKENEFKLSDRHTSRAYQFVDLSGDGATATRYRLTRSTDSIGRMEELSSTEVPKKQSRYLVRWSDASTTEDRNHWIACGRVQVIHKEDGELLGERLGCMFDRGLGSTAGERSPWAFARNDSCPSPRRTSDRNAMFDYVDRLFVEKVIVPVQMSESK